MKLFSFKNWEGVNSFFYGLTNGLRHQPEVIKWRASGYYLIKPVAFSP